MMQNAEAQVTLSDAEILARDEEVRKNGVVANVETLLMGTLKNMNTFRTKRTETAKQFGEIATAELKRLQEGVGKLYESFELSCACSGVKKMGIYVISEVTLRFTDGSERSFQVKSKMKTWEQSEEVDPSVRPVKKERKSRKVKAEVEPDVQIIEHQVVAEPVKELA